MADNFTEALIDAVRQYPVIYNVSDPDYKDLDKKNEAWQEISSRLQQESDVLKTRWRSLRDCYSKYKRTLRTTTGQATKKYKKWPWAQQMSFLDAATALRLTSFNVISTISSTSTSTASTPVVTAAPDNEIMHETLSDQENVMPADNCDIGLRKRRTKLADPASTVVNYLKDRDQNKAPKSDIDLLFRSYAETFKKYKPLTQSRLKIDMAILFAEAEIREIEQQQLSSYRNSSAYSIISTDSTTPSPRPEDLRMTDGRDEVNIEVLDYQTLVSPTQQTSSYRNSSAYSTISTNSVSAQSYIATPTPRPEDLSISIQQSSGRDAVNFELNYQTPVPPTQQLNIQQQNSSTAALPSLQPLYLDRTLLQTYNNEANGHVTQYL